MAIVFSENGIFLPSEFPFPDVRDDVGNYRITRRNLWDNGVTQTKVLVYFPGTGATDFLSPSDPLVQELCADGWLVHSYMYLGTGDSSDYPWRYGYGNVNAPHFMSYWIRSAWEVEAALNASRAVAGTRRLVALGQSRGAASLIVWSAGFCGSQAPTTVLGWKPRGMIANAPGIAGLGTYRWNDMNRNINTITNMIALSEQPNLLITAGGSDPYAPPDYVKRFQQVIPEGKDTYILTPNPGYGHSWMNTTQGAPIIKMWADQLYRGDPITLVDGVTPAIPGPVV